MTTKELRERLLELDPSGTMEVLNDRCSDWEKVNADDVSIVRGVAKPSISGRLVMRAHPTMSEAEKVLARDYVHIVGN